MAVRFYDEALWDKIQRWIRDPNMTILKPNETSRLFQLRSDQNNDKPLTLPLIALSRDTSITLDIPHKRNLSFNGVILDQTREKTVQLNAIPLGLNYQLDIYTKRYDEGDEYLRNFIFNFVNHPQMKITLPYNGAEIDHICYVRLEGTATDNSDIGEKLFADEFTRWTLQLRIDDAYLFSIPIKDNIILTGAEVLTRDTETNELEYQGSLLIDDIEN